MEGASPSTVVILPARIPPLPFFIPIRATFHIIAARLGQTCGALLLMMGEDYSGK